MIIVGVDPDSEAHGIAIFENGELIKLEKWGIADVLSFLPGRDGSKDLVFSIENVMKNQFVYARNRHDSKSAQSKIAMHIGRCQQAQVELERVLTHFGIKFVRFPPQKGNWANNKALFESATGWKSRSNEDTRSAAFFGYLFLTQPTCKTLF